MALFGNVSADYTKTGKGGLTSFANKVSFVPIIGPFLALPFGMLSTIIETGKWIFQGKFASAATALVAGTVSNLVNTTPASWWLNDVSGLATGVSMGTHARALTETIVGGGFKMLGQNPTVMASYPAGIGSINGAPAMGGKDNFRDKIAAERGLTRQQMDARADQAYVNMGQSQAGLGA